MRRIGSLLGHQLQDPVEFSKIFDEARGDLVSSAVLRPKRRKDASLARVLFGMGDLRRVVLESPRGTPFRAGRCSSVSTSAHISIKGPDTP